MFLGQRANDACSGCDVFTAVLIVQRFIVLLFDAVHENPRFVDALI